MRWQPMQLEMDVEAHHRALRRCHGCGAYARVEEVEGSLKCERCAKKARREREERSDEDLNTDLFRPE